MARVLVVDDNEDDRELYALMLYYNGYEVLKAEDPITGLELAHDQRPDLILMDYRMPRMDGLTATMMLQAHPDTASIPVVCVSAEDLSESSVRAAGCEELIRKPTPVHELIERVRSYVDAVDDQFDES